MTIRAKCVTVEQIVTRWRVRLDVGLFGSIVLYDLTKEDAAAFKRGREYECEIREVEKR